MDKHSEESSQTPEIEESSQEIESDLSQDSQDYEYDVELIRSLGKNYRINATHLK